MILQERIQLLARLGEYMLNKDEEWLSVQERAYRENAWFIPEFLDRSIQQIAHHFLQPALLAEWATHYGVKDEPVSPKTIGIVMAGNIPLVGFHDFLSVFISGHPMVIKTSSKDEWLIKHLVKKMYEWEITVQNQISFAEQLKGCDAYIATGSNNSGRYFEYYFGKYPNIIRRNRTSVAVLDGTETKEELSLLTDDIQLYFGLGCRNITQLYVPVGYDFIPLLEELKQYAFLMDYHKYKHNYDYHLALLIMGNKYYMNNDSVILTENISPFSPVSQVHYTYYTDKESLSAELKGNTHIQCVVGHDFIPFGQAQQPKLMDYADGVDTMAFLQQWS
ncbi:acyl-CoA reductase [Sediminibacterium goheungense]|uniref:Acyl-CoA reductase LuxC n=1 Tax=Sediminibacterium goheungense TaxID=1086393 RepID=A0A4R6J0M7_9BACT|nr:acyl-CoA reductase [Sediminibacterium goheungense]TDO28357.1 acyl-CoA reductase LuxC [Sediminibacterium goheungense]